jgi:hypothetical protein
MHKHVREKENICTIYGTDELKRTAKLPYPDFEKRHARARLSDFRNETSSSKCKMHNIMEESGRLTELYQLFTVF